MKNRFILLILLTSFALAGCDKPEPYIPEPPRVDPNPKTLIMYGKMKDWYTDYYAKNIKAVGKAVADGALAEGHRVLVFEEETKGNVIYELLRDRKEKAGYRADTLKRYAPDEVAVFDPADMKKVLTDMRALTPEAEHFGLSLGMHGRGWLPNGSSVYRSELREQIWRVQDRPLTRNSLTRDLNGMDIPEFSSALEGLHWDFILFDVCLMSSIEALYDMRNLADYMIVSPAEILIDGFPYERVVKILFEDWTDLAGVARSYVDYYRGNNSEATIAVVKNRELEALANTVREIYKNGYNAVDPVGSGIQYYEELNSHVFFDLDEYMRHWAEKTLFYLGFAEQLEKTVVFSDHTEYLYSYLRGYGSRIPIHHYSGITAYIPTTANQSLLNDYKNTGWYKAVFEDAPQSGE